MGSVCEHPNAKRQNLREALDIPSVSDYWIDETTHTDKECR